MQCAKGGQRNVSKCKMTVGKWQYLTIARAKAMRAKTRSHFMKPGFIT